MEQDPNSQNQEVDPQRNLVTKLINHYEPNVEVTDDYYKSISEKYQDVDTLVTKLINHYEPKSEVTTDYLNGLYSKYGVKKKEKTEPTQEVQEVQETPTPVVSGVSEEPTPSPSVGQKPKKSSGYGLDISKITPEIISLEEDEAISFLKKNYSQLGFHFEKAGIGDAVRVSRDGNEEVFDFDPWTSSGEKSEAERLKKWMTENSTQDEVLRGKHALKDYTDPSELQLNVSDVVPTEEKEVDSFDRAYDQFSGPSQKLMVSGVDADAINELNRQKEEEAKKKEAMRMAVGKADGNVVQEVSGFEEGIAPGQDIIISNKIEAKKARSSESHWEGGDNYYANVYLNYLDETSPNQANDLRSRIENDKNFFDKEMAEFKSPSAEVVRGGLDIALGVTQEDYVNASEKASGIVDQITELEPQLSQHLERIDGKNYNGTPEQFQEYSDLITQINQLSESQEMRELRSSLDALNSTYRDYETNPDVNILDAYETIKDNYQRQVDAAYYKNSFISDILTPITDGVMRSGLGLVSNVTSFVNNLNADNEWGTTDDIDAWAKGAADTYDLRNPAPSKFSRDFYEEVTIVGDYEVELKGGKPTGRVFGSNGYLAQTDVSENILKQYNKDPELYDKETNWNVRSGLYTSTEVGLDMVMGLMPVAGVFGKGFKAIGASETLAATLGMSSAIVIQSQDEFVQMAKDAGANDQEALAFGMAQSAAISAIAAINPIEAKALMRMTGASQRSIAKKYVQNIVGGMSRKDAAAEVTKRTLKSTISKLRAGGKVALKETERLVGAGVSGGKAVLKEAGKEGLEETLEIPAGDIISNGWQTVGGVNTYSEKDIAEYINTFFLAGAGSLPFAFLGLGGDAKTSSKKELTYSATQNIDTVRKLFEENIGKKIKDATGKEIELTQEYIDEHIGQLEELNKMSEVYFSNKNLTEADKIGITDLLSRKKSLESKAVDDVSKKAFQSTIDDIDASLNEYLNKGPKTPFYVINGIAMNKQQVEERLSDEDWVSGLKNGRFDVRVKNDKQMQERLNNVVNGKKQKGRLTKFTTPQDGIIGEVTYEDGTRKELTQEEYDALEKQEGLFDIETGTQPVAEPVPTEVVAEEAAPAEGRTLAEQEEIQTLIDVIDLDPKNPKNDKYKTILKDKYDYDYNDPSVRYKEEIYVINKGVESKTVKTNKGIELTIDKTKTGGLDNSMTITAYDSNGNIVGSAGFNVDMSNNTLRVGGAAVDENKRRQGIYSSIYDEIEAFANKNNLKILEVGRSESAKKFHESRIGKQEKDAIQEQAAGEVPVQPEAKAGEKVEEGKPQAEPEKPTEKGKEEVSEEEVNKVADTTGTQPKNIRDLYNINRDMFGQDRVKSLASAIVMDMAIAVMAKRAGISKSEMYSRLQFKKAENVPDGVKFQVDAWHGSPYEFTKFELSKIGIGEGAQAFGWGLYFTDLKGIATYYAESVGSIRSNTLPSVFWSNSVSYFKINGIDIKNPIIQQIAENIYKAKNVSNYVFDVKHAKNILDNLLKGDGLFGFNLGENLTQKQYDGAIQFLKNYTEGGSPSIELIIEDIPKYLYKVSLHKGKTPDQYTYLEWDKGVDRNLINLIKSKLTDEQYKDGFFDTVESLGISQERYIKDGETLYNALTIALGSDKAASLFLLENGIDGIKYPSESVSRGATSDTARASNYVVFDENSVSIEEVIKFQKDANKARGAAMVNMDGTAVIYAMTDPNVSTPLHEIAHVFEHYLTDAERKAIMKFAGTKEWGIETSEKFARGFEKYLADGIAPTEELQKIFDKFKQWMLDIYNGITGSDIDIQLNDEMRDIYDKMLGKEPVTKKTEKELSREVTFTNIYDIIEKVNKKTPKKANPKEVNKRAYRDAYNYLLKSDWFASATDIEQTEAIDDLKKLTGQRRESSPSAQKILGIDTTKEKISVDQKTVRGWMMKDLAEGYKLGKRDAKKVMAAMATLKTGLQRELVAAMREIQSSGKISKRQVDAIVNKFQKTNVFNPDAVESFLNYIQKVVDKADHIEAINEANSTRKQIKRRMKNKDVDNNLVQAAKEFAKINPNKVDDIDAYNQLAAKIKEGLGFSMNSKQGVKFRSAFDISTVQQYSELELKRQKLASDAAFEEMFKEMFESDFGMTVSEMRDFYGELENQDTVEDKENRAKLAMSSAVKAFDTYSAIINEMLESGIDSFTGEKLDIDENTKRLISEFMEIDITKLPLKDAIRAVDALNNFVTNQTTGGLESIVRRYNGEKNVENLVKQGVRSFKLKLPFGSGKTFLTKIVESYINAFASLPNLMDNLFGGVRQSLKVENAIGFSDVINGRAKAIKKANQTLEEFLDKFEKKEANGEDFNTAANMTERGLLGFMRRTVLSTDEKLRKAEFERRKNLVKESIEKMMKFGSEEDFDKAQIYMDAYNKLLEGSNSIEEVESKADPVNKEAVEWWSNKFNEILPELTETSINVYNTVLENESNYNPDVYKRLNEEEPLLTDLDEDAYNSGNGGQRVYDKKNPMLMRVSKPSSLPKGRYVSLDFDVNNFNSYQAALVDINTAASIQQLKGALESDAFMQLVPDYRDRKMLKERMTKYVAQIRGKGGVTDWKIINRFSNIFARVGTATSLGGLLQPAKQTLPVFVNTLVNSGMSPEVFKSLAYVFDKDISNAINNSGMPIANRGAMSETTIDDIGKLSDKLSESKGEKTYELIKKGQDMWMKYFLQQPDAFIARASFLVFYKQDLKKMGINPSEIDWKNHKWNKEAANYAQRMVDRQQNVSDTDLQGTFLSDQTGASPIIRKILLPFQNFVLNQKNRMYSDIKALQYGSKEDKKIAANSLFGLMAEWASFTIISIGIQEGMYMAAESIISQFKGDDDDEEAKKRRSKEKERRRQMYIKSISTSASKDFLSPLPVADEAIIYFINKGLEEAGTSVDRGEFEFSVDFEKKVYEDYQKEILDIDDEEMKFEKSMYYLDEIVELQKEVDGEMYDVHRQKINELNERFKSDMEYTKNIRQDVERYMKKIEKERKPFQLYDSGKTKTKVADFLGSVGIAYDRMYKIQDMFTQAASLEYEQDMYGRKTVKKIPKELQNAMYIAAVAQLGSTLSVFPSEFASTSNKIQKLVQQQAKSESQLEAERKDEIKKLILKQDEYFKGYESGMYSYMNQESLKKYKKRITELTDDEILDMMMEIGY